MSGSPATGKPRIPAAHEAALEGIEAVVSRHLAHEAGAPRGGPQVVLVDGRFASEFVDRVATRLRDKPPRIDAKKTPQPWAVVRFDAWQYQRLAPPWWWLITTMDRELQAARPWSRRAWGRVSDYTWRIVHLVADMALGIVFVAAAVGVWVMLGTPTMTDTAKSLSAVVAALSGVGLAWSGLNAVRRRLLLRNPANAEMSLRTSDPMARLRERYEFLVRSAHGPVIVVVDNLDRCHADYVVELLEGIHTLLKPAPGVDADANFVAFMVPADRSWLCDSFMQRYSDFKEAVSEPGRPFGLSFVDKVFDVMLCLPRISPACARMPELVPEDVLTKIADSAQELEIRRIVHEAEKALARQAGRPMTPVSHLRIDAVVQIGKTEAADDCDHACSDTKAMLDELTRTVDVGPVLMHQLRDAYCVHRTGQLLGGHAIDVDDGALLRLGRWTVLDFRWPLLTAYLREHPGRVEDLKRGMTPDDVPEGLRPLFAPGGDPQEIARGLTADAIRRFASPLTLPTADQELPKPASISA